jgi:hypothetical protein
MEEISSSSNPTGLGEEQAIIKMVNDSNQKPIL